MKELSKECWDKGHEVYEDMLVYEWCKERVFFCKDCKKVWVCIEDGDKFLVKNEFPITISNKELSQYLTWEVGG